MQLRKKLCYFMIMILSCCDLLVVLTAHPFMALVTMLWLTEKFNVYPGWLVDTQNVLSTFVGFSVVALFVMSVDRYLAIQYPIFHRTSVTKGKLLTLFVFLVIITVTAVKLVVHINNLVLPYEVGLLIFGIIFIPSTLFINCKLLKVARKYRGNNGKSLEVKRFFSLKNISTSLWVILCLNLLSIPSLVYIALRQTSKEAQFTLDGAHLAGLWAGTAASMNSTFNSLIFYWKNNILRAEGMKVIKSMMICRRNQSSSHS